MVLPLLKKLLPLVLTAALLTSCGLAANPTQQFSTASRDFAERLRWRDIPGAAKYMADEHREDFLERFLALDDLHIVDLRLESVDVREEERRAVTWTVMEYYLLPSITVEKLRLRQEWALVGGDRYHPGAWQITTPFPPLP